MPGPTDPAFGAYDAMDGTLSAQNGNVLVRFYSRSVKDEPATEAAGHPIFRDTPYIRKLTPGDPRNIVDRPVREADKEEFPVPWGAFSKSLTEKHEGTDLAQWPSGTRSQVESLKYNGVFTVEELAVLDDRKASAYGAEELRERARDYLNRGIANDERRQLREQMAAKDAENESLRNALAEAQRSLDDGKRNKGKG